MREFCPHLSFPAIGRIIGGRDHATIIHATKRIAALIVEDIDLHMAAEVCRARLAPRVEAPKEVIPAVPFWAMCYAYERAMQLGREGRKAA
jgi:hypothetical protein